MKKKKKGFFAKLTERLDNTLKQKAQQKKCCCEEEGPCCRKE